MPVKSRTRRAPAALSFAVLALGFGAANAAGAATGHAGVNPLSPLMATATKAADVGESVILGPTSASQILQLDIALEPRDPSAESAALKAMYTPGSTTYHHFLTPAEYAAEFGPTSATLASVTSYLRSHGMWDITVLADHLFITATANATAAESAFHTRLSDYLSGGLRFYANTLPALIPDAMARDIEAVVGLDDIPLQTPHPEVATRPRVNASRLSLAGVPPADFQNTYEAAATPTGAATSIAIFTEGSMTGVIKSLRLAEVKNHLAQVPVTQVDVGPQSTDTSGADEFSLDTQSSTAMASTVKHLYLYTVGSLVDSQVDAAIAAFVAQDRAVAMSASVGECDIFPYLDGSMVSTDTLLQEGALQGQTLFAGSGDNGEGCEMLISLGVPAGVPGTNWPASGEFTTAVGGTSLLSDSAGNRIEEIGWIGSGGGISEVENPGWWTLDTDPGYDLQNVIGGRAVPDVALDADPNATPALIYVNGNLTGVGGTSLASPLMLGAWARLQSAHNNDLGFAAIDLYGLYDRVNPGTPVPGSPIPVVIPSLLPKPVYGFTDIKVGTNGLYPCLLGYDEVTGLGAPDVAALDRVL